MSGSLLVIKDKKGSVFGGFATDTWKSKAQYYGSGECFLFAILPENAIYKWTGDNNLFMFSNEDSLAMGGGGNFGIYLDSELKDGTSGACKTFGSPCIASEEDFEVAHLELWEFQIKATRMSDLMRK